MPCISLRNCAGTCGTMLAYRLGRARTWPSMSSSWSPWRGKEVRRAVAAVRIAHGRARHARRVPVGGADPQPAVPALREPVRQADMVRVHVRADHAQHRQALQLVGEDLLPRRACAGVVDAAVDDGPAFAPAFRRVLMVAQQPQVDVVQREGQLHAQPAHAFGYRLRVADGRQRVAEDVMQFAFKGIGHAWATICRDPDRSSLTMPRAAPAQARSGCQNAPRCSRTS